jgi:non-ribosomal peptide synthetase component F
MWQSLKRKAVNELMTHSSILCAAFAEVLSVWSGENSFTINTTVFNRIAFHKEVNNILGDFTSTILLEVDWSKNTFKERYEAAGITY